MSLQICIRTDKSLDQLATEIRDLFSLPPFNKCDTCVTEPYYQFDVLGMFLLLRRFEEDERDPEVKDYSYVFDLQMSFEDHGLDTDEMVYSLQPYYAQLLSFRLGIETACYEKKKVGPHWQIRYCRYCKNPRWNGSVLYGEAGWEPAVLMGTLGVWRTVQRLF
jgi:hypothetical protein